MQSVEKSKYQLWNRRLSFLCRDREEKSKNKPYNVKDKCMSKSTICADKHSGDMSRTF